MVTDKTTGKFLTLWRQIMCRCVGDETRAVVPQMVVSLYV